MPGHLWYSRFFSATVPIFILYNIFYPLAGLRRVRAYRREVVNYSADDYPASVGWLYRLIFLIWLSLPLASGVLFVHKSVLFSSSLAVVGAFLPIFQYLIICYNLLSGNYVIIEPAVKETATEKTAAFDSCRFERYMCESKPYLNPKLRITDVAAGLGTNRSYISSLVNGQYGMNFTPAPRGTRPTAHRAPKRRVHQYGTRADGRIQQLPQLPACKSRGRQSQNN